MEIPLQVSILLTILGLVLLGASVIVYGGTLTFLVSRGGRVEAGHFSLPDLLSAAALVTFLTAMSAVSIAMGGGSEMKMTASKILSAQMFMIIIVAGIGAFLHLRGLKLQNILGLNRVPFPAAIGWALLFLVAGYPIVAAVNQLSSMMVHTGPEEQGVVTLFRDVAQTHDYKAIAQMFVATVLLAPPCEEFLFRGFFYGVGKRYIGSLPSGIFASLFFAASHVNLVSLPGLFVLALCLTAAYERTGSLLVPIGMHAFYNFTSLAVLYFQSQTAVPISAP